MYLEKHLDTIRKEVKFKGKQLDWSFGTLHTRSSIAVELHTYLYPKLDVTLEIRRGSFSPHKTQSKLIISCLSLNSEIRPRAYISRLIDENDVETIVEDINNQFKEFEALLDIIKES